MTYEDALTAIAQKDPNFMVLTAENRGHMRTIPPKLGDRFIDVGIAEQTMIGMAAGLALRGRTPVCHALATFLTLRAFEFIRTDVGIPRLPVKLVGMVPGFLSDANGPTHQAIEDVAIMRGIPHMQVFCPADREELCAAMPAIVAERAPCYIRYLGNDPACEHKTPFDIGKAEVIAEGSDVTILTYGFLVREALKARAALEERGISTGLIHVRMPKPLDEAAVLKAAKQSRLLVTYEDHFLTGGLYSIVCELLVRSRTSVPVHPIALEERWFKPALLDDVLKFEKFTGEQVAIKIAGALNDNGNPE
ncbi:MAG: 1-deoxy-D-xylulose-5-phosphate synthase [Myxococcota bacterium]|nr:1-deoxy-D-xylulose-5-phosphate synthase [Myxococcota bacterium]